MDVNTIKSVYFIGAGGIGMSALVRYFLSLGKFVAGYDRTASELTERLNTEGASIHYEDNISLIPENCKDKTHTLVVYTPAVPQNHSEFTWFREQGYEMCTSIGHHYPQPQRALCSRNTRKDNDLIHGSTLDLQFTHRSYGFSRRHITELRDQSIVIRQERLCSHRSR
mgnify:CR=1 FL=1